MRGRTGVVAAVLLVRALAAPPSQVPLRDPAALDHKRSLHGRFLHITDFHPDPLYEVYSATTEDAACHRDQGPAGVYGAETSECDSPISLINKTLEWVGTEWKDKIDFIVWTGDSARHDSDEDNPRSDREVLSLNEFLVSKMFETFGKHNGDENDDDPNNDFVIPIIPTFGNNDILPHNIFDVGPNRWTRAYARVWERFIPEEQKHSFEQGGWFYVEAIPNQLAVFSLNSLYFFAKNAATDGCAASTEPGFRQLEWLRIQLQYLRTRGMKAILTGHVPPVREDAKTQWDETCWQKYTLWLRQYRDVVLTNLWGHFNYDHFFLHDFTDIDDDVQDGLIGDEAVDGAQSDDVSVQSTADYFVELRDEWSDLPKPPKTPSWFGRVFGGEKKHEKKEKKYLKKIGGPFAERFAASFVASSVVPNLLPAFRIFEYNITGLENIDLDAVAIPPPAPYDFDDRSDTLKKKKKKHKFVVPDGPSKSSPPGPAYSPQTMSLIKYSQYYANLTHINNDFTDANSPSAPFRTSKWNEGKHKGQKPHEKDHTPHPKKFRFELHYDTREDAVYHLDDLTMPSLVDLARRIGDFVSEDETSALVAPHDVDADKKKKKKKKHHKKKKKKGKHPHKGQNDAWFAFVRRAYVETLTADDIDEDFS